MQESGGDPLKLNGSLDGGAGIAQIQPGTGKYLKLSTFGSSRSTGRDRNHGISLRRELTKCKLDLICAANLDDRFNPVLAIDAAARYLVEMKKKTGDTKRYLKDYKLIGTDFVKIAPKYNDWIGPIAGYNTGNPKRRWASIRTTKFHVINVLKFARYFDHNKYFLKNQGYNRRDLTEINYVKDLINQYLDSRDSRVRVSDISESTIKKTGSFTKVSRSDGEIVYKYKVKKGDTLFEIANLFNKLELQPSYYCKPDDFTDSKGNGLNPEKLDQGSRIYLKLSRCDRT